MGKDSRQVVIIGSVSRHNSPQDRVDDALWELFVAEIAKLIENPKYTSIAPWVV